MLAIYVILWRTLYLRSALFIWTVTWGFPGSLEDLFTLDLQGRPLAAVRDYAVQVQDRQAMFDAGFMVIDT